MDRYQLKCKIKYVSSEILAIAKQADFDAVLSWVFNQNTEGISIQIKDEDFSKYKKIIDEQLKTKQQTELFEIIPVDLFGKTRIVSVELFKIFRHVFSTSTMRNRNYYTLFFREMHLKLPSSEKNRSAELILTHSAIPFFESELYREWMDPEKNTYEFLPNYPDEKIKYGSLEISPKLTLFKESELIHAITLEKEPVLSVVSVSENWDEINSDYCEIFCYALSLYSERFVYPWVWNIWLENSFLKIVDFDNIDLAKIHAIYQGIDFKDITPIKFLNDVNLERAIKYKKELSIIVENRIRAYHSRGVNRFMQLFVILEMLKDMHLRESPGFEDEEPNLTEFKVANKEASKTIEQVFEAVKNIVVEEQKEFFQNKYSEFVKVLKYKTMKNQFHDLFKFLGIDVDKSYKFDFSKAIAVRNKIFHGMPLSAEDDLFIVEVGKARKMSLLASHLIYSFFFKTVFDQVGPNSKINNGSIFVKKDNI